MGKPIKKVEGEKWKKIEFESPLKRYAVSNMGRIASYNSSVYKDGADVKLNASGGKVQFMPRLAVDENGKRKTLSFKIHRLVAIAFLKQPSKKHTFVIHINKKWINNKATNLQWVTPTEMYAKLSSKKTTKNTKNK